TDGYFVRHRAGRRHRLQNYPPDRLARPGRLRANTFLRYDAEQCAFVDGNCAPILEGRTHHLGKMQMQDPSGWLDPVLLWPPRKSPQSSHWPRSCLSRPIFMIAQKVAFVPVVHRSFQEQPAYPEMSHLLKSTVGCVDAAADDPEAFSLHLLAEQ